MKALIFIATVVLCTGCSSYKTVMTVSAEASVYERTPFADSGASTRIAYRIELDPLTHRER